MATMTTVTLVDDLDGSEASGSVSFALDGASYEIDLSEDNAEKLRDALAGYVASARRVEGRGQAGEGRPRRPHRPGSGADRGRPRVGPLQWLRGFRARPAVRDGAVGVRGSALT